MINNMAMKLVIETVKARFPRVPYISTGELWELMKKGSSSQKLVLLVSIFPNLALILHVFARSCETYMY